VATASKSMLHALTKQAQNKTYPLHSNLLRLSLDNKVKFIKGFLEIYFVPQLETDFFVKIEVIL
jgi:hypothetical protein